MGFLSDVATYLQTNGIGTLGTNLFYSYLPKSPDAAVAVLESAGPAPDAYLPEQEPGMQIVVRSLDYDTGAALVESIRSLLHQQNSITIGSTFFFFILLNSEDNHLGRDDAGRDVFSMNFHTRTR